MKKWIKVEYIVLIMALCFSAFESCKEVNTDPIKEVALNDTSNELASSESKKQLTDEFKAYWYAGLAEITSYELKQARYGEMRDGNAVLIYVTEPFSADKQVKADNSNSSNIPVLKLNSTKNFLTGIYPYSVMSSSFYPVHDNRHALKLSFSMQEWCGHVYGQLNNREKFEVEAFSYFESEGDQKITIDKTILENELWNKIRINPSDLPLGSLTMLPSFEYLRMAHKDLKPYSAEATRSEKDGISIYEIKYPELERTLTIRFNAAFPHEIESWSESYPGGFGNKAKMMTSTATKMKTIKSPYWTKGSNKFLHLRDSLGL